MGSSLDGFAEAEPVELFARVLGAVLDVGRVRLSGGVRSGWLEEPRCGDHVQPLRRGNDILVVDER